MGILVAGKVVSKYDVDEAKGLHRQFKKAAATTGSKVHDWCEDYVNGKNPAMPDDAQVLRGVNAFLDWVKNNKVTFIVAEQKLYSKEYGYCGQADCVFYLGNKKNEIYLGDYKTSTGMYDEVMLQTAAYVHAWTEMPELKQKIKGRYVIRIEKRSEQEFNRDMEKKGKMDVEYLPIEPAYLDYESNDQANDFAGFLNFKGGRAWHVLAEKRIVAYKTLKGVIK